MLSNIKIYDQNHETQDLGYDNCDSLTNGEFFVVEHIIDNNMMVFDIGANVGAWSKYVKSKHENCKINCFEPVKSTYDILCKNFKNIDIKCNNYAISKDNKDKTFYFYGPTLQLSELSTLYQRSNEIEKRLNLKANRLIVNCITVDSFCKNNNINKIDYLKIDVKLC
jgi:FkbM family methyltransferase